MGAPPLPAAWTEEGGGRRETVTSGGTRAAGAGATGGARRDTSGDTTSSCMEALYCVPSAAATPTRTVAAPGTRALRRTAKADDESGAAAIGGASLRLPSTDHSNCIPRRSSADAAPTPFGRRERVADHVRACEQRAGWAGDGEAADPNAQRHRARAAGRRPAVRVDEGVEVERRHPGSQAVESRGPFARRWRRAVDARCRAGGALLRRRRRESVEGCDGVGAAEFGAPRRSTPRSVGVSLPAPSSNVPLPSPTAGGGRRAPPCAR